LKSVLTFEKWTKKMSKFEKTKYSLLTKKINTMLKIYRNKLNEKFLKCDDNFFVKKLKDFFLWRLYGAIGAKY
jgi:hypothetical protein